MLVLSVTGSKKEYTPIELITPSGEIITLDIFHCPKRKNHIAVNFHCDKNIRINRLPKKSVHKEKIMHDKDHYRADRKIKARLFSLVMDKDE